MKPIKSEYSYIIPKDTLKLIVLAAFTAGFGIAVCLAEIVEAMS